MNLFDNAERELEFGRSGSMFGNLTSEEFFARIGNIELFEERFGGSLHYIGVGRHFCERTGNFYRGGNLSGMYATWFRDDTLYRRYRFIENGYNVSYYDWHGERIESSRNRISQDSARYQTGCPFLNGFETLELKMLDEAFTVDSSTCTRPNTGRISVQSTTQDDIEAQLLEELRRQLEEQGIPSCQIEEILRNVQFQQR